MTSFCGASTVPAWFTVVEADLIRRGDAATPLLLNLFHYHDQQEFRENLLSRIDTIPTISLAPYLETARNYWLSHMMRTPTRTCHAISHFLRQHGTAEDTKILQDMQSHPSEEVVVMARSNLWHLTERLNAAPKTKTEIKPAR